MIIRLFLEKATYVTYEGISRWKFAFVGLYILYNCANYGKNYLLDFEMYVSKLLLILLALF